MENILQYYTNYRKLHYDDNVGIAAEEERRKHEQQEFNRQMEMVRDVQKTVKYQQLEREKQDLEEEMELLDYMLSDDDDTWSGIIRPFYSALKAIRNAQLDLLRAEGVDFELLEKKLVNVSMLVL